MVINNWELKHLLGYCTIKLDQRCKVSLLDPEALFGLSTEDLLVESDGSLTGQTSVLTSNLAIKLLINKCPKKMPTDSSTLPTLNSHYTEENVRMGVDPIYLQPSVKKKLTTPAAKPQVQEEHVEEKKTDETSNKVGLECHVVF